MKKRSVRNGVFGKTLWREKVDWQMKVFQIGETPWAMALEVSAEFVFQGKSNWFNWSEVILNLTSLVAQTVKNLPAMQEIRIQSLCWEDPLEKEMATHSSILAWEIQWTEEPGGIRSIGSHRGQHNWSDLASIHTIEITLDMIAVGENEAFNLGRFFKIM